MSTRCNVAVKLSPESTIYLYRHCDGYLAGCGDTLARAMTWIETDARVRPGTRYSADKDLVTALLALKYDHGQPVYELTDGVHGDIEYFYEIQLRGECAVRGRPWGFRVRWSTGYGDGIASKLGAEISLADFWADIIKDTRAMESRAAGTRYESTPEEFAFL